MRVLTLIHLYPPHHIGGYEVACRGIMERFRARGHEVVVLTGDRGAGEGDEGVSPDAVEVRRELRLWWNWETSQPLAPGAWQRVEIERHNQRALHSLLDRFQPDVASVWDLAFVSLSLPTILEQRRIPIVLTFLDDWITLAVDLDPWTRAFEHRPWARPLGAGLGLTTRLPTFEGASASFASEAIGRMIDGYRRWEFPGSPIVPFGVDTQAFPVTAPDDHPWAWHLLYVGRVNRQKGVHTIIGALPRLPAEARLDVVGHAFPEQLRDMQDLAAGLGVADRVAFSESSHEGLRDRYRSADLVVFSSEWEEPFGLVPLEAMACGVPVIATGTGGSGEYLRDGENCLIFRAGDSEDLARTAQRVAKDVALRGRLVEGGMATAGRLNMDRCADELERLHQRAARGPKVTGSG
jgi:glycogen(starch) synthase